MSMELQARLELFGQVVGQGVWTDRGGQALPCENALRQLVEWVLELRRARTRLYVIGNGGSAAIAAHAVNDLVNMAAVSAFTVHDAPILTCMTNDYGYENAYARMLSQHVGAGDMLVAISSSGRSMNIRNAVDAFRQAGGAKVFTLSGFGADNPLRAMGDLNVWLDSDSYGMVEIGHQFILHNLSDRIGTTHA